MRVGILLAWLIAAPALAGDDLARMNAVSNAWDRYAELSSQGDGRAAEWLAPSSLAHYGFLRDAALYASSAQLRRIPMSDRAIVYAFRATQQADALAALDDEAVTALCLHENWCGIASPDAGESLAALSHVTLVGDDLAMGELGPPTGTQFMFGPELVRDQGQWKVRAESMANNESLMLQQQVQRSGIREDDLMQAVLAYFLGPDREAPLLALLGQPLRDDAAARTRLNERWPRYDDVYKTRVAVLEKKAADGDTLAQMGLGALLATGSLPAAAPKDRTRGIDWLEKASAGGQPQAAAILIQLLIEDYTPQKGKPMPADLLARLAVQTRRAAEGGIGEAMLQLSGLYFNGAGGLARDCILAEQWGARAEDAGVAGARNNRVWALATCPLEDQRDPQRAIALADHMMATADTLTYSELDTVAAALAAAGRTPEAADYQQRAIARVEDAKPATLRRMQQRLAAYRKGQDWVQDYNTYELPAE
ncbi:hypothetical protein [Pseudoxanthomonas putridarboris]|uniref:Sel1 repeat family protein n=1 Tax=Pseudoxanthomonas putridarboris TaxID=752605 RepID=A0ABU9IXF2_9GAMM